MAVNDIYEVTLHQVINGDKIANRLYFREQVADSDPFFNLSSFVQAQHVVAMEGACSNEWTCERITVRRVSPTQSGQYVYNSSSAGSVSSHTNPPQTVALFILYTAQVDASGRGKFHVSGIPVNGSSDGLLVDAEATLLDAVGAALINSSGNFQPVLWNKTTTLYQAITDWRLRTPLWTLRSRKPASA